MADSLGKLDTKLSLGEFLGTARFIVPGESDGALVWTNGKTTTPTNSPGGLEVGGGKTFVLPPPLISKDVLGKLEDRWDEADVWFDQAIVVPLSFAFGNILSTQTAAITIYSSYRFTDISLNSVINNLGAGVSITGLPALPTTIQPQSGFSVTLEVTTDGSPVLDDTVDFVFSVSTQKVAITGRRIVMFPLRPEVPLSETLEFLTDVMKHVDGSEQRVANRMFPRQTFEFNMALDGPDRQFLDNLLYDWQSRVFGLPVWTEPSFATADITALDTAVSLGDTTLGDFRVDGLAIIFSNRTVFDALVISGKTSTTLTFTSPIQNSYPRGTQVLPLRIALASPSLRGSLGLLDNEQLSIRFNVLDNNVGSGYASTTPFATLNSKVLLDGPNAVERRIAETLQRKFTHFDNDTGKFSVSSPWSRGQRISTKGFVTHSREELLEVRKLIHALKGKQISFYLPTFYNELELTVLLQSGTSTLTVTNVGFAQFAKFRAPARSILRVVLANGTILIRTVVGAAAINPQVEQLTVDSPWPSTIPVEDVKRIEYIELVRSATDRFLIQHTNALGDARITFPVKTVFE